MSQSNSHDWLPIVRHEPDAKRFVLNLEGVEEDAVLHYEESSRGETTIFDFVHTEVPEAMRGRGMAAALVRTACEYARSNDVKVVPTCSYVVNYLQRNPADNDVVARD